jgi:hypothetical protein
MTAATTTAGRPRAATPASAPDLPDELLAVLKRLRLPYLRSAAGAGHRASATLGPRRGPPRPDHRGDPRP